MAQVTINEAMEILKQLTSRHQDLIGLRNANSSEQTRYYGANADKPMQINKILYDAKALDKQINAIAKEVRILKLAIKATNQSTKVKGYDFSEEIFGELG